MDIPVEETMSSLTSDIQKFVAQMKEMAAEKQKEVASEAAERLVYYSPVWTGAYVKSMRCGVGTPDPSHEPYHIGTQPYPMRVSEMQAEAIRIRVFDKLQQEIGMAKPGERIFLSNSIPYADQVEYVGWYLTPDGTEYLQAAHHVFTETILDLEFMNP
jgi:hypothetical protein